MSRASFLFAVLFALVGCTDAPTQIIVTIDTDYEVPAELAALRVRASERRGDRDLTPARFDERITLTSADRTKLPFTFALTSGDDRALRVHVELEAYRPGESKPFLRREAIARFVKGKKLVLPMNLVRRCEGVVCSGEAQTCGDNGCESIERTSLTGWTGEPPAFEPAADTMDGGMDAEPGDSGMDAETGDADPQDTPDTGPDAGDSGVDSGVDYSDDPTAIKGIALGPYHSCVWTYGGDAYCWGDNMFGQLGSTPPNECADAPAYCVSQPAKITAVSNIVQLAAGEDFTCALNDAGRVLCFGKDDAGQLGNDTAASGTVSPVQFAITTGDGPVIQTLEGITDIAAGENWACARQDTNRVYCWGDNASSTLGVAEPAQSAVAVRALAKAVDGSQLFSGLYAGCVLEPAGKVACWGSNAQAQLQSEPNNVATSPSPVTVIESDASDVSVGGSHVCAVVRDDVLCWGSTHADQLGVENPESINDCETTLCSQKPLRAALDEPAKAVSAGAWTTCALVSGGRMFCWGETTQGIVANSAATEERQPTPLVVTKLLSDGLTEEPFSGVRLLPPNHYEHVCVVRDRRDVFCWGGNDVGQLGPGATLSGPTSNWDPLPVPLPEP